MKKIIFFFFCFLVNLQLGLTQIEQSTVHLKNGGKVIGKIIEKEDGEWLRIKTPDHKFHTLSYSDIAKISQPDYKQDRYKIKPFPDSKQTTFGFAASTGILDAAVNIGVPIRYYFTPHIAAEFNLQIRYINEFDSNRTRNSELLGTFISAGPVIYSEYKIRRKRNKIKRRGLTFQVGYSVSTYPETQFTTAWVRETFRQSNPNRSFIFNLGLGISSFLTTNSRTDYTSTGSNIAPLIFIKCHWNFLPARFKKNNP